MDATLLYLSQIRENLQYADYKIIKQSIADMRDKFLPIAILHKDGFIDRIRINKNDEIFYGIDQVSYIQDECVLKNYVNFGRANEPNQAIFYGSIISDAISMPRVVAYSETSSKLLNLNREDELEEIFTLSRWRIKNDIKILEMIYSENALKVNRRTKESFDYYLRKYPNLGQMDHLRNQGIFFSNEFARNDVGHNCDFNYKISAAFSNYIFQNSCVEGITYPSVSTNYLGQNVALLPKTVNQSLELETVAMFKAEKKKGEDMEVFCIKIATDLGPDLRDFQWVDYVEEI